MRECIRQHTSASAYVSIRQHTSAYISIHMYVSRHPYDGDKCGGGGGQNGGGDTPMLTYADVC